MTRRPLRVLASLLVVALLAGACSSGGTDEDPSSRLAESFEETFRGSFAYHLEAVADRDALEAMDATLGPIVARLNLFQLDGVVDGDAATMAFSLYGLAPIGEFRRFGDDEIFLRFGVTQEPLSVLVRPDLGSDLTRIAEEQELPRTVTNAIAALFRGEWVGVTGAFDPADMEDLLGVDVPSEAEAEAPADGTLAGALPDLVRQYVEVTDEVGADGSAVYGVELRVVEVLATVAGIGEQGLSAEDAQVLTDLFAGFPERVAGTVGIEDGVVTEVVFDIAQAARDAGDDVPGSLVVRLELTDHGAPDAPERPDDATLVDSDELLAGLAALLGVRAEG